MKKFLSSFREGFPFFIYYVSLFVTTGYFTSLCASLYSCAVFAVFSVLYISLKHPHSEKKHLRGKTFSLAVDTMSVSALVFSILCETGISVRIFTLASDTNSGKSDLAFFSVIICTVSLIIALHGMRTTANLATFGWIVPITVLLPCIVSLIRYGTGDIIGFVAVGNLVGDILSGSAAFLLLVSDYGIICDSLNSDGKNQFYNISLWSKSAVFFVATITAILCILFGKDMSRALSSALMSGADASGGTVVDEMLLVTFSFCILLRLSMKMIFVYDKLKVYFAEKFVCRIITAILITVSAGTGAYIVTRDEATSFMYAQAILNFVSFILLPFLANIFGQKNKYAADDPI